MHLTLSTENISNILILLSNNVLCSRGMMGYKYSNLKYRMMWLSI